MGKKSSVSIIKMSKVIRQKLKERFIEMGLTHGAVCRDAVSRGISLNPPALSRFFKTDTVVNIPSEEVIVWLCLRYGISIVITIDTKEYDEEAQLENLKLIFPNKWEVKYNDYIGQ